MDMDGHWVLIDFAQFYSNQKIGASTKRKWDTMGIEQFLSWDQYHQQNLWFCPKSEHLVLRYRNVRGDDDDQVRG